MNLTIKRNKVVRIETTDVHCKCDKAPKEADLL